MNHRDTSERSGDLTHPYVEEDLKLANQVSLDEWLRAVLDLPQSRYGDWKTKIGEMRWFEDGIIQRCLRTFCAAEEKVHRCEPFTELGNRILHLARGKLPGVPKTKSYPVDDFCFLNNADRAIATIPEHGALGAIRCPDILNVRSSVSRRVASGKSVQWTDILLWWELKKQFDLTPVLEAERKSRGLDPADEDKDMSPLRKSARKRKAIPATKLRTRPSPLRSAATSVAIKRRAEDNLPDGLTLRSSNKARRTDDLNYSVYLGKEAAIRSGSYALELLSCTYGTRVSCFSGVLQDDKLSLWYYDAEGVAYTTSYLSILSDFESCAAIIVAIARCKLEQFGVLPASVIKPHSPYPRSFPPPNLGDSSFTIRHPTSDQPIRIILKRPLFAQYVLQGRRTFVYTIETSPATPATDLIAKFAYQVHTRKSEHELVTIARKAGVQHLPEIHMWADLWKLSEGARRTFYEGDDKINREDRILRMIVYTQYASIKPLFLERCELIPIMVEQMADCLHDLRYKANILHRDISVDNVMYEKRGNHYFFILIDFDMGVVLPRDAESSWLVSSRHRTGTLPFMAWELIRDACRADTSKWMPIRHLLRHDLESLFWLSLWCVLTLLTHTVEAEHKNRLLVWARSLETGPLNLIAANKESLSNHGLRYFGIELPGPAQCLARWFAGWTRLLRKANTATGDHQVKLDAADVYRAANIAVSDPEPFDEETAGGTFTKDVLNEVLSPLMPLKSTDTCTQNLEEDGNQNDEELARELAPVQAPPKPKRRTRDKVLSKDALALRECVLSKLRPRKRVSCCNTLCRANGYPPSRI
ncbi:hypothetical protein NM688_g4095 [Phlebia brevispora]|uniref:Uncharacterized protein n=1 Tax=Phlebia brevispora TaxID=194682 RepID=A0ACC1T3L5_9APHY|nr:hypothetical protein NM688_g4095 [Phlebia brevispora]